MSGLLEQPGVLGPRPSELGSRVGTFSYRSVGGENVGDEQRQHPAERKGTHSHSYLL